MPHFAVAAVGADRPGIVAAVSRVFVDLGCNLEDSSMTILRGHFAMMLVVDAPRDVGRERLEGALRAPADALDLAVTVRAIDPDASAPTEGDAWTLAVYGTDRPGIVHEVTALLAAASVNIVDVSTRVIGDPRRPAYAMILDVVIPPSTDAAVLRSRLEELSGRLGVSCSLHPAEADIL